MRRARAGSLASFVIGLGLMLGLLDGGSPLSAQVEPPHHYIVYLGGLNSTGRTSVQNLAAISSAVQRGLKGTVNPSVYFSYGAAAREQGVGGRYCAGWGQITCTPTGDLESIFRDPEYNQGDTKNFSLDRHAEALNWLLGQVVRHDPLAQVDLVGYSLGGVVASRWAARFGGATSGPPAQVRSLVLLESPVGGVAEAKIKGAERLLAPFLGQTPLAEMQTIKTDPDCTQLGIDPPKATFACSLRKAAVNYDVTAIESLEDYFVNNLGVPTKRLGPIETGLNAAAWPTARLTRNLGHLGGSLATEPLGFRKAQNLFIGNHKAPLTSSEATTWILQALSLAPTPTSTSTATPTPIVTPAAVPGPSRAARP